MDVKRRRGIHKNDISGQTSGDEDGQKDFRQCSKCLEIYMVTKEGSEQNLSDKKQKESKHVYKTEHGLYPTLQFVCAQCRIRQEKTKSINTGQIIAIVVAVLVIIGLYTLYLFINNEDKPIDVIVYEQTPEENAFDDELDSLEHVYRRQEERVWYSLSAGIKSVLRNKPNRPSVFLMLFDNEYAGLTAKCLAKDISKPTTKLLMSQEKQPILITGTDLIKEDLIEDSGLLLVKLNNTVRREGALILTNLHEVPAQVAKSFHFICDSYSPLVEKAVLFFTLKVDQFLASTIEKTAQQRLEELWSGELSDHLLKPLITRMTPNVLKIVSDSSNC